MQHNLYYKIILLSFFLIFINIETTLGQNSREGIKQMKSESLFEKFKVNVIEKVKLKELELNCRIGLAFKDKETSFEIEYRANERFHAASTMKLPVMIDVFRQAEAGIFSLDDKIVIDPICKSFLEDTTFECDARGYIKEMLHKEVTIRKVTEEMITVSDNLATNLLIAKCGYRKINSTMRKLGAKTGYVLRGIQDEPAYLAGLSNRMTAHDLNVLNQAIDKNLAASPESCAEMRKILLAQKYNDMIPELLPDDVKVAHKTGSITGVRHDSAIIYADFGTWYLTILTDSLKDGNSGKKAIAELSLIIYEELKNIKQD